MLGAIGLTRKGYFIPPTNFVAQRRWSLVLWSHLELAAATHLRNHHRLSPLSQAMPTTSLSSADKDRIKSLFPSSTGKISAATLARIYYAYPSPDEWSYAGLQGAIVLMSDKTKGGFWFRLVDLAVSLGLYLWSCLFRLTVQ